MTTRNAPEFTKEETLPFAQYVVDGNHVKLAGPFWTYASAELACRVCRYSNHGAIIVRADELE